MKKAKKNAIFILTILLSLTMLLSACSKGNANNENSANNDATASNQKEVVLKGYLLGEAPKGMPEVLTALNEKLKKDINATIELNYIGWGDVQSKYPLLLAAGEDVDFIFSADWNSYVEQANKGAFYELKPEDIAKYMPKKSAAIDPAAWEEARINGKIYMIPKTTPDSNVFVSVLRKDIMAEAGLTEVKRLSEIGPYLEAVKKNHPDMIGLNLDSQVDLPTPYQHLMRDKIGFTGGSFGGGPLTQGISTDYTDPTGKIYSMVEGPYLSAQKYAAGIMKDWYDKGYVNKNPYANKIRSKDNFVEGKSAVAFGNTIDIAATIEAAQAKGIESYIIPSLMPNGKVPMGNYIGAGVSIAANSKNPERVMQAMDLIMEDPSYVYLAYYGIEGKNYVITPDDKIGLPEGVTADTNSYPPDASGFWFVNKALFKPMSTWPKVYADFWAKLGEYNTLDYAYNGFSFNSDKVKTQIANLANASTQFANPIYIGAVKDVDKAFDELSKNLNSAGLDKVKAEVEAQAEAFLAKKK
ncbi:ABC transporter substrate-binding protein [Paenibacillus albidus]|uniref:ABC transporter substrate-binding protein n=1 Tax=Paenibacillus albidus TaxID=2041023 RepID=UPI001BEAAEF7|nr:ABC transporter substrate-binding protein [Paenibacillus albidus]MBT2291516.1 ABC transporter substrate-binding protein [Paenibacillus albidus]